MIYVKRDAGIIPKELLDRAVAAQQQLEQLPADKRAEHIKKNSKIWRDFKDYLSRMSYGKCWYSESPEAQSHLDVDHFRPKLEARRDEKVRDKPGYDWLAFSWENFRLSAQLSNRPVRNEETDETDGKGSWFPLVDGSPKACWENRCVDDERPMLLDPINAADVRLIEVHADGRMGPSKYCYGTNKRRVQESIVRLGLDLPRLKEARLRVMRDVKMLSDMLGKVLDTSSNDESFADKAEINAAITAIQIRTHPREPYAAAARSQLRMMGLGELCFTPEEA
ncbi:MULTISPECIES: hypothetical protein [Bradyrhizobium]|uniref:hypothetical protein n=1 Tax=Bradyrhizobium TaxID=374 RepID=UPI000577FCE6|nr:MULTISPECIES: hypothetical protein [Bradyrhizobium]MDI2076692.1 hypothetical protein [Bradyrhizobium sp. Mp27]